MGFLDFIAGVAEVAMQGRKSSLNRIERKYGVRMTDAQRAKMDRIRSGYDKLDAWCQSRKQKGR